MKTQLKTESSEAIASLKEIIKPGDTVYTILRHCSTSGMSRVIDLVVMKKNQPVNISWRAAKAMGDRYDRDRGGIKVGGCGMDMGFHLVYSLGRTLFPKGFVPSRAGQRYGRNGSPADQRDTDGGYALNQRWL